METSAVILAGGLGRRMGGRNKALLAYGPDLFIERQIRVCAGWTDEIIVVSNDAAILAGVRTNGVGVKVVPDRYEREGPLAGLYAGLAIAARPYVWLLACDQPLASAEAATLLLERLKRAGAAASLPVLGRPAQPSEGSRPRSAADFRPQPLHAIYRKEETAAAADELLRGGERRLRALLHRVPWVGVSEEQFERLGIATDFADDVDTPEDYDRIRGK